MSHIVDAGSALTGFAPQSNRPGQLQKDGNHRGIRRRSAADRDKQGSIERSNSRPNGKVPIQGPLRCVMQRDESTLFELGLPNNQTIRGHVLELQRQGFGDAQTCSGKEAEQRGIRPWSD